MKGGIQLFLKGAAMGAANVIPGVSGGTIAFITGIYEPFIKALKAFDGTALRLLSKGEFKSLANHINLSFLVVLILGLAFSLFSLGKLLDYLFLEYPVYVWSFFFGLIAISILSVGRTIQSWNAPVVFWSLVGTGIAVALSFMKPAAESDTFLYLMICGVIAMASMILPGLSGSFVLILMGNYQLIMLRAVPNLDIAVLIPVGLGAVLGFVILSRVIDFMLNRFHDHTISLLTGFIFGSLLIIWPWKDEVYLLNEITGDPVLKNGEAIVQGYDWLLPSLSGESLLAGTFMVLGVLLVLLIEKTAKK